MRQNLEQAGREGPEIVIPEPVEYLWGWFFEVSRGREIGFNGACPLSALEIKAWVEMTGNHMTRFDFHAIREMDAAYLSKD